MTDPELYDTRRGIPDVDDIIEGWHADAAGYRERWRHKTLDVAYGPAARNDVDLFWPSDGAMDRDGAPLVVFVHGGYWRRFDRRVFSHFAEGLVTKGVAVAMPSYTLAPEAGMVRIVEELRSCARFLYQTYGRHLTVIGHSAGAHLAASLFATDWRNVDARLPEDLVRSGFGLSGIYDLAPLLDTEVNETLGLDAQTARAASPLHALPPALRRFDVWVGRRESSAFHDQTTNLARRWTMTGVLSKTHVVPNAHHFNVLDPLRNPRSRMVRHVLDLVADPEGRGKQDDAAEE